VDEIKDSLAIIIQWRGYSRRDMETVKETIKKGQDMIYIHRALNCTFHFQKNE
jgi:hypothetical protein